MDLDQRTRWQRIRDFPIGPGPDSRAFIRRLADEQGWTPVFAARVVEEYRRFMFLAATGQGTTPSKIVDEAWHLHLIFTRNYWDDFCPNALGKTVHHDPGDGSGTDEAKHQDWYAQTLIRYEEFFQEPPPRGIWPRRTKPKKRWPWAALLPLLLAGCDQPANPLDWAGPDFLGLFLLVTIVAVGTALLVRYLLSLPSEGPPARDWQLHTYDKAYLNGGPRLALAAAIAHLSARNEVKLLGRKVGSGPDIDIDPQACPLDRAVRSAVGAGSNIDCSTINLRTSISLAEIEGRLRRQGLWISKSAGVSASIAAVIVMLAPLSLGVAKMVVGTQRGRPIGFLAVEWILALIVTFIVARPPKRSRYGSKVLNELRNEHEIYREVGRRSDAQPDEIAAGVALFGFGALAGGELATLSQFFITPPSTGSGSSSSSCTSSSCSGGSSCGGGGCGGCSGG